MSISTPPAAHGSNAFLFVIVTVALDMMAFGIIIPVIPSLLQELTTLAAEDVVVWGGALTATFAIMNFLAGPTIGGLSDRYGRRPVLLASIATLAVDFLIMGLADTLALLFLGRALAGISSATFSTANAYIADVTSPDERGRAFGMVGAAFGIGFIIGPAIGGLTAEVFGTRAPFFIAAGFAGINFLYGVFLLPESLPQANRRRFDLHRSNPLGAFAHFSKLPKVAWFLVVVGLFGLAHSVYPATWNFHGEIRYDWSAGEIGFSLALVGIGAAIVQAGLIGSLIKHLGALPVAALGIVINALSFFAFAFAALPWMAYAIIPFSAIGGIQGPAINTVMANLTPKTAQGELQGASASLMALAMIISPLVMTQTLQTFSKVDAPLDFPGAAFFLAGVLTALCLVPFALGARIHATTVITPNDTSAAK